jgi:hypothetical protein
MTPQEKVREQQQGGGGVFQSCDKRLVLISDSGVLSRLINTDQIFSSLKEVGCGAVREKRTWWGSNLPNNVAASLDPVVQKGETRVRDKISEAHVCGRCSFVSSL